MKCPHCLVSVNESWRALESRSDSDGSFQLHLMDCPACHRLILKLMRVVGNEWVTTLIYPRATARTPVALEVPVLFASDYREACAVFSDSPKASAALSRRCLQNVIHEHFRVKERDLSTEIDKLIGQHVLGSELEKAIDSIRNYGNFAAHPIKSSNSGAIVDVEPGEAELCLDVLEDLFDYCFVVPARRAAKKAVLDQKLADAGKPPSK